MFLRYNLPGIIWGVIILILTGMPGSNIPRFSFLDFLPLDKIIHFILFFVFYILIVVGLARQFSFRYIRKNALIVAFFISIFYGALTEWLQGMIFEERTSNIYDFFMNASGSILGLVLYFLLRRKVERIFNISLSDEN